MERGRNSDVVWKEGEGFPIVSTRAGTPSPPLFKVYGVNDGAVWKRNWGCGAEERERNILLILTQVRQTH